MKTKNSYNGYNAVSDNQNKFNVGYFPYHQRMLFKIQGKQTA